MKLENINISEHYLIYAKEVYEYSFPPEERLDFDKVLQRQDERYQMKIILDESDNAAGILFYWNFDTFVYIEHFAFSHSQRGKGQGSAVLKEFTTAQKLPVILEIELPETLDAQRRLDFYQRLGFVKNEYPYIQPPYSKEKPSVEMLILSTEILSKSRFEEVKTTLYREMYKVKTA